MLKNSVRLMIVSIVLGLCTGLPFAFLASGLSEFAEDFDPRYAPCDTDPNLELEKWKPLAKFIYFGLAGRHGQHQD